MKKGIIIFTIIVIIVSIIYIKDIFFSKASDIIIKDNLTSSGDGLYADIIKTGLDENKPFSSKYYFKGDKVNNYIIFENNCWQIINIANNDTIKIMYFGKTSNNTCSNATNEINNLSNSLIWAENTNSWSESNLSKTFDEWVTNNKITDSIKINFNGSDSKIVNATWYTGAVRFNSQDLEADIEQERINNLNSSKLPTYQGKIGLINSSDYLKISCGDGAYTSTEECRQNNFLAKNNNYWTITPTDSDNSNVWAYKSNGKLISVAANKSGYAIYPVIYLKSSVKIKGKGTIDNPYVVIN